MVAELLFIALLIWAAVTALFLWCWFTRPWRELDDDEHIYGDTSTYNRKDSGYGGDHL